MLYRFFSRARWCPGAIGRRVFEFALRWVEGEVEMAVDDTLCKRTGVRRAGRPRKRGVRLRSPEQIERDPGTRWRRTRVQIYSRRVQLEVFEQRGLWYSVDKDRLCRMIVIRDPRGRYETRAIVTTDLRASAARIIERYSRRWLIEVMFRHAKQHLGLGHAQNGWEKGAGSRKERRTKREEDRGRGHEGRLAVERTLPALLERLRPWAEQNREASFEDLLSACRVELASQAISSDPGGRHVRKKLAVPLVAALAAA